MAIKALTGLAVTCALFLSQSIALRAAAGDIVMYASDATVLGGHWTRIADAGAAGGQMLTTPDTGLANTAGALAAPSNAADFTFSAVAGTSYRIWIRLRAGANSNFNDSVFLQFSDALDASGAPLYRTGTTSGLVVNRQICNGCPLPGWGWFNGAYWLQQPSVVSFAAGGTHTLRLQTREDGIQIDQIVRSPMVYFSQAPGSNANDQTIVAKAAPPATTPFTGTSLAIPTAFPASDFDNGGEGLAYHDTTPGNSGGRYRNTGVDIENCSLGGVNVGWIASGEWLVYAVDVGVAGSYRVTVQVASPQSSGRFHARFGATDLPPVAVPMTGGWQSWTTVTFVADLIAGPQAMTLVFDSGGFNVAGVTATRESSSPPPPPPPHRRPLHHRRRRPLRRSTWPPRPPSKRL